MAVFSAAIGFILKHEGGYVNNPKDPGGETKYGISKTSYPNVDISALTEKQAQCIYLKDYWNPNNLSSIKNQDVATKIFDMIVNLGKSRSVGIIQGILNDTGHLHLVQDGDLGLKTIEAINEQDSEELLRHLCQSLSGFYSAIVTKNPSKKVFLKGWLNRANDLP